MNSWLKKAMGLAIMPCLAAQTVAPPQAVAILQIRVAEGEGAVHAAGSRATRGLSVEVTDETGRPVGGAAVNFRLPDEGPSGVFANGMKTEVVITGPDGRATVWGMQWNRAEGQFHIRITAARGQARAGTVVSQYLSLTAPAKEGNAPSTFSSSGLSKSRSKWLWIGLLAAGTAVGGGLAAGMVRSSKAEAPASSAPPPPVLRIGTPTIDYGKP